MKYLVPTRNACQMLDYLQKSGTFLDRKEAKEMEMVDAYYLVLKREAEHKGFDGYKEI